MIHESVFEIMEKDRSWSYKWRVKAGLMIHESVFEIREKRDRSWPYKRPVKGYKPYACLPDNFGVGWDRNTLRDMKMLEGDAYASAAITIAQLKSATEKNQPLSPEHQNALATLPSSGDCDLPHDMHRAHLSYL
ncbi:hypothetical protein FA95DRAFT_1575869 [Auriscalpium vulgare]|uniref:Uncharacterized protein n=1 Tax=Auriscalpium vulgare TaxID=40419 RepID=A0ACB8RED1_9AGAM|nr:hypothetical protein FA95DRAFT_1575869 [Auriscalpium vulgare]